jgi:hypothetical protein
MYKAVYESAHLKIAKSALVDISTHYGNDDFCKDNMWLFRKTWRKERAHQPRSSSPVWKSQN